MVRLILFASLTTAASCCYADPCVSLVSLQWLLGNWVYTDNDTVISESWRKISPLTFEGRGESRSVDSNTLQSSESLRLADFAGEIFYLAKVGHNELPVAFRMTECDGNMAVFENQQHDFPKQLAYYLTDEDILEVVVSDGMEQELRFRFNRR